MQKVLGLVLMILMITGCFSNRYVEEKDLYDDFIEELKITDEFNDIHPFDISVSFEKVIDKEITYRVIIDNPKITMKNIRVIAIHDQVTTDIFPTSGIFDQPLNLIPDEVNVDANNVGGIILVGYIPYDGYLEDFKGVVKVLLQYEDGLGNINYQYYQYQK